MNMPATTPGEDGQAQHLMPVFAIRDQAGPLGKAEFEALATFRYAMRRFLRFSESAARAEGLTPQQHELLLAIKGFPGEASPSVSDLAKRLQLCTQSMVGLLDRVEALGLLRRVPDDTDHRRVLIALTSTGNATLRRLVSMHRDELHSIGTALLDTPDN